MKKYIIATVTTALAAVMTCPAYAQSTPAAVTPQPAPAADTGIADIVVTAQRQKESSQRAAVAIDVVDGSTLSKAGITRPEQLSELVPALTISPSSGGRTNFFVRGIGNFTATPAYDSAIAFNYDGVYVSKSGGTSGTFYDLERVEVLLGPQGTLYGRNATGGAINVIPVKPKPGELSGYVTGSYGNYNAYSLEGAINVPLGSDSALRISGNRVKHDGYLSDGSSADDSAALRVQMLSHISPDLTVRFDLDFSQVRGQGTGASWAGAYRNGVYVPSGLSRSTGLLDPASQAFRETLFVTPAGRLSTPLDEDSFVHSDNYGAMGEVDWSSGAGTLTFIPAWRRTKTFDSDAQIGAGVFVENENNQYSAELRFVGNRVGLFDYQAGAYFFKEVSTYDFAANETTLFNRQVFNQGTNSIAGFGRITAHVSDSLRLVGAARETQDKKYFNSVGDSLVLVCTTLPTPCSTVPLFPTVQTIAELGPDYTIPQPGQVTPVFSNGAYTHAILVRSPTAIFNTTYKKSKPTFRAAAEYDIGPKSLLYASIETGFRSGGLQQAAGYEVYKPETITAYTIGSKNRFFENKLQLNVEAFYWKYKNQQLTSITTDIDGRSGNFVKNIGSSTNYGADVDAVFLVKPTTRLAAKIQYLKATYDQFSYTASASIAPPITPCKTTTVAGIATIDCSGFPAFNAPKWTVNLEADQTVNLSDYKLVFSVDTQFKSSRWVGFEYQQGEFQGASWTSNAQVEFSPQRGRWAVSAFVRNIENDRLAVNAFAWSFANAVTVVSSPPRTYGVRARVAF